MEEFAEEDIHWLESLAYVISLPAHNAILVHAGLVPGLKIEDQNLEDLYEIRSLGTSQRCSLSAVTDANEPAIVVFPLDWQSPLLRLKGAQCGQRHRRGTKVRRLLLMEALEGQGAKQSRGQVSHGRLNGRDRNTFSLATMPSADCRWARALPKLLLHLWEGDSSSSSRSLPPL